MSAYAKLDLVTGDVYTQARCRFMETQHEKICAPGTVLTGTELAAWLEATAAPAIAAGVLTIDLAAVNTFRVALNANITTLTIANIPASGKRAQFDIRFTADGTPRTIAFGGATVRTPSGGAYTPTSTNNKVDWLSFVSVDGGATWDLFVMGQNF